MIPFQNPYKSRNNAKADRINENLEQFREDHPLSKKTDTQLLDALVKDEARSLYPYKNFSPDVQLWLRGLSASGIKILEDGFLEIQRWDNTGVNFEKPKKLPQRVDDIDAAIRMQDHILNGYITQDVSVEEDEHTIIDSLEETIEEANALFLEWKFAEESKKEEIKQKLANVVLALEKCRNEFKVRTRDKVMNVLRMKDGRGRENPSALAARTVGALNNLQKRIDEMGVIAPKIAFRKELLIFERRRSESLIRKAEAKISFVLRHTFFTRVGKNLRDEDICGLSNKLLEAEVVLAEVVVAPYFMRSNQALHLITILLELFAKKESATTKREEVIEIGKDIIAVLNGSRNP